MRGAPLFYAIPHRGTFCKNRFERIGDATCERLGDTFEKKNERTSGGRKREENVSVTSLLGETPRNSAVTSCIFMSSNRCNCLSSALYRPSGARVLRKPLGRNDDRTTRRNGNSRLSNRSRASTPCRIFLRDFSDLPSSPSGSSFSP